MFKKYCITFWQKKSFVIFKELVSDCKIGAKITVYTQCWSFKLLTLHDMWWFFCYSVSGLFSGELSVSDQYDQLHQTEIPRTTSGGWKRWGFFVFSVMFKMHGSTVVFHIKLSNSVFVFYSPSLVYSGDCCSSKESYRCRCWCFTSGHGLWLHLHHTGRYVWVSDFQWKVPRS